MSTLEQRSQPVADRSGVPAGVRTRRAARGRSSPAVNQATCAGASNSAASHSTCSSSQAIWACLISMSARRAASATGAGPSAEAVHSVRLGARGLPDQSHPVPLRIPAKLMTVMNADMKNGRVFPGRFVVTAQSFRDEIRRSSGCTRTAGRRRRTVPRLAATCSFVP